ncbi:hypothetical protein ASG76_16905 [Nocardioides sp. Soil774]|uniref:CAP domain-containing protein n=1 Tax=Nocardioides sp. Soil774 TaxID=1736408 RepID=UPI0006F40B9C|nr:CAP domain-containing protein [Nocardioides sp. Soil774]KRE92639.1 hypothetical protein ASG76_16905 [Nocardioides sp. Soil774]
MRIRPLTRLVAFGIVAAAMCGLPSSAGASTWPVPVVAVAGAVQDTVQDAGRLGSAGLEDALMVEINAARASHGLRKIRKFDACTDTMAEQWGSRIARTGVLEHRDQREVVRHCRASWAGETLVRGEGLTPGVMVELWLDSPPHRKILLSPRARHAGVAITQDQQGRTIGVVNLVRQ